MSSIDPDSEPLIIPRARPPHSKVPSVVLLRWGQEQLSRSGVPLIEARWLLEWASGAPSSGLLPETVGIRAAENYRSAIAQRRSRIPLQHIMGEMDFRRLTLKAGQGVFIVRPETEYLVELALPLLAGKLEADPVERLEIVDLCAGSGAIGLSFAKELPNVSVTLVELDGVAGTYLKWNVEHCGPYAPNSSLRIRMEDATHALSDQEESLDMVASNPPYIGARDMPTQQEALVDPPLALYGGGEDGLILPRGIVGRAFELLKSGGHLIMEHGEEQSKALVDHALAVGFHSAKTLSDLTGRDRYLLAEKK